EHGMVDAVVPRKELKATLARILGLLMRRGPTAQIVTLPQPEVEIPGRAGKSSAAKAAAKRGAADKAATPADGAAASKAAGDAAPGQGANATAQVAGAPTPSGESR